MLLQLDADYAAESGVAISPDAEYALTASWDNIVRPWQIGLRWVPENRYIPEFTCEEREQYNIQPLCGGS